MFTVYYLFEIGVKIVKNTNLRMLLMRSIDRGLITLTLLCTAFLHKNNDKAYFDQQLEWAKPKHWSKYTTGK